MRYIAVDRRGPHMWVTFDRPDKLNVLHAEDLPGLRDIIANLDPGVTGLVFTGAGPAAFSAGMDIETFAGMDRAGAKAFIGQLVGIMQAIRRSPAVTVAAVSGYCLGGAFELALACDLRVVTTTAVFGLPEIKAGVPSVIDAALLPGFVGLSKAREMILTGDNYRLDQLPPHSIANVITEPGLLAEATGRLLERTATHTRTVTAAQRRLFGLWLNSPLDEAVERSTDEFAATFEAHETREQIARHYRRITHSSGSPWQYPSQQSLPGAVDEWLPGSVAALPEKGPTRWPSRTHRGDHPPRLLRGLAQGHVRDGRGPAGLPRRVNRLDLEPRDRPAYDPA